MAAAIAAAAALSVPGAAAAAKGEDPPRLDARAWMLVDARDGTALAASAAERRLPIASATKLMTAHLALERLPLRKRLPAAPYSPLPAESILGLRAGERISVRDLLYALILASANDAAVTIAEAVSGSVQRFVAEMNRSAESLGLDGTHYANPIGFDAADNYSTASDLVELATRLLEDPLFARIADSPSAVLRSGARTRRIPTRNTLLLSAPWVTGVKTGHTLGAGYVLVGSARRDGTTLVSAVLGASSEATRDAETLELLRYGFTLYRPSTPVRRGEELAEAELSHRDQRLGLVAARTLRVSAREDQRVEVEIEAPDEVDGPVGRGERVGRALVTVGGRPAAATPLVAATSAEAATFLQRALATVGNPVILVGAGAFVIVVGLLLARGGPRRLRERTPEERRIVYQDRMRRRRGRPGDSEDRG
jgi:D-alanyl-D-alanine carboxypeptidase (penicillin-binding protein 5/6)